MNRDRSSRVRFDLFDYHCWVGIFFARLTTDESRGINQPVCLHLLPLKNGRNCLIYSSRDSLIVSPGRSYICQLLIPPQIICYQEGRMGYNLCGFGLLFTLLETWSCWLLVIERSVASDKERSTSVRCSNKNPSSSQHSSFFSFGNIISKIHGMGSGIVVRWYLTLVVHLALLGCHGWESMLKKRGKQKKKRFWNPFPSCEECINRWDGRL